MALGPSIRILLSTYAPWVKGGEDPANALIEAALSVETVMDPANALVEATPSAETATDGALTSESA
ncbi:hypothetical protein [Nonomuraea zeae]|uniref:Uncharacterized protein n=1 Tax=Nonomuraea zeae TaxID=1642303 RepID=A0A5S4FBX4_9ACTN|nr:hypothetical protein [Nonomuraea zeae]TMR15284.1 hypothetical protein ETD85_56255 [Nonomuraea zeae]